MTDYENIYRDMLSNPHEPCFRLLTLLPGPLRTSSPGRHSGDANNDDGQHEAHERKFAKTPLTYIENGPVSTDLEVKLKTYPLNKCPNYEALSYTWGELDGPEFSVKCDGYNFLALGHLKNALTALRLPDRPRTLWIDAICINQNSKEERGQQVAIMRYIYRNATRAVVWLGLDGEENYAPPFRSDVDAYGVDAYGLEFALLDQFVPSLESCLVFHLDMLATEPEKLWRKHVEVQSTWERRRDLIKIAAQSVKRAWESRPHGPPRATTLDTALNEMILEEMPKLFRTTANYIATRPRFQQKVLEIMAVSGSWRTTICNILCREWWSRVWIIQEACLASEVTFLCGHAVFDLDLLFLGLVLYTAVTPDPRFRGHISAAWSLVQIMEYRTLHQQVGSYDLPSFLQLLEEFRPSYANNPVDHVYGLMGLVAPDELSSLSRVDFKPDYSDEMTVSRCFTKTASAICMTSSNLDILSICHSLPHTKSSRSDVHLPLPSWVPNWSVRAVNMLSPMHGIEPPVNRYSMPLFSACGSCQSWAPCFRGETVMVISGHVVDTVTSIVSQPLSTVAQLKNAANDMAKLVDEEDEDLADQGKNQRGICELFVDSMARVGGMISVLFEWEQFALTGSQGYPTGEDMRHVFCAVRCFGYMPDGLEAAMRVFNEYMNALSWCRRMYDLTSTPCRPWTSFRRRERAERKSRSSKMRQTLVALAGLDKKKQARMNRFNALQKYSVGRKLAWTKNGLLGLVPRDSEAGDQVIICRGSKLPLVLRPANEVGQWRLLGACYVHGMMYGEMLYIHSYLCFRYFLG
ncbi:heterokaryon incompatibility protein-domain-containing protein [Xylariales sp. AK1849]|nr:heterokaryon incompatibility protein-domain-containing protein [Xylariales sp. AK1849]